ncbi:glycosyltransferase [bacterium]|nr:glycosyltransferase [bacterium]
MYTLRMPDYLSLWKRPALEHIKDRKFDIVVSSFGPYVTHLIAEKIIENKQAERWIADYRDLWIDHGLMKGLFPFTVFEKKLQYRINNKANFITTVSKPLSQTLCKRGVAKSKVHVIYNGYLEQSYSKIEQCKSIFSNDEKKRLVYTGSIYEEAQNYIPFLESLKKIKRCQPNLFSMLEVIIASRNAGKMVETTRNYNINECFVFTGAVSHQIALQMQKEADVLLFLDYDSQIMPGVITGKLFEYMISGTEIWSIGHEQTETDANSFLIKSNTGRIFGNDVLNIYGQHCNLLTVKTKPIVNKNIDFIQQFSRESQAIKMLELILQ